MYTSTQVFEGGIHSTLDNNIYFLYMNIIEKHTILNMHINVHLWRDNGGILF